MNQTTLKELTGKEIIELTMKFLFDSGICTDPTSLNGNRSGYRITGGAAFVMQGLSDSFHYVDIDVNRAVFRALMEYECEHKTFVQPVVDDVPQYVLLINGVFSVHSKLSAVQKDRHFDVLDGLNVSSLSSLDEEESRWLPSLRSGREYFYQALRSRRDLLKHLELDQLSPSEAYLVNLIHELNPDFDESDDLVVWRRGRQIYDEIVRLASTSAVHQRIFDYFVDNTAQA